MEKKPSQINSILNLLRSRLPDLQKQYGVRSLGVFGSYVRGEQGKDSDLDILVDHERTPTLMQLSALQREISKITGIHVDLVLKRTLRPIVGKHILSEVIYL